VSADVNLKVGFASCDWSRSVVDDNNHPVMGGSGWARLGQYVQHLNFVKSIGVLVFNKEIGRFGVRNWSGEDDFDLDVIVMQRIMFSDLPENMKLAQSNGQFIINDLDDWYWGLSSSNKAFESSHPKTNPNENINHYKKIIAQSDLVTVSTPYLAERIEKWITCQVKILPNTVDLARFSAYEHSETTCPTVGWVGSTAHRSNDLQLLKGIIDPLVRAGHIRLHHSGHHEDHPFLADQVNLLREEVTVAEMVAPSSYPSLFTFDIGIVPLSSIPFNRAKSFIKGLEYAAMGLPFVASNLDAYEDLHRDGIGLLARKNYQWKNLLELLRDPLARAEIGAMNRLRVKSYDIQFGVKRWQQCLNSFESQLKQKQR